MIDDGLAEGVPVSLFDELLVEDAGAWRAWLAEYSASATEVWLVLAKKGASSPTRLRYQEALEEALCYGWIDGQVRRRDDGSYRQRFTPRRSRSGRTHPSRTHPGRRSPRRR